MSKESTTTSEGKGKAKFNFQAQTPMELSLIKGEMVTLTRRVDQNWYEGRIGSRKGIFPATYIDILVDPGETRGIIFKYISNYVQVINDLATIFPIPKLLNKSEVFKGHFF